MASIGRNQQIDTIKRQTNTNTEFSRRELDTFTIEELKELLNWLKEHGNRSARRLVIKVINEKERIAEIKTKINIIEE